MAECYETKFINRSAHDWPITERYGAVPLAVVPAGGKTTLVSQSATTMWSKYSKVVIGEDGKVKDAVRNDKWQMPYGDAEWQVELVNDDKILHSIQFQNPNPLANANGFVHVGAGLFEVVPLPSTDPSCQYERIRWHEAEVMKPLPGVKGYFFKVTEVITDKTRRPQAELDKILAIRKRMAEEKAAEEVKKEMAIQRKSLGLTDGN